MCTELIKGVKKEFPLKVGVRDIISVNLDGTIDKGN